MCASLSRPGGMRASCSAQLVTEPCNRVKRPRNVHSKRHGPVEHLRLLKTGSERLSFVNCRTLGSDDASVQSKLSSYVMQLTASTVRFLSAAAFSAVQHSCQPFSPSIRALKKRYRVGVAASWSSTAWQNLLPFGKLSPALMTFT